MSPLPGLVRREETEKIRFTLEQAGFVWSAERAEFASPSDVAVPFLMAADRAGTGSEVRLPDPADENVITHLEGLPVLSLTKLRPTFRELVLRARGGT